MDWIVSVFTWLMVHQPPFPWSLLLGLDAFAALSIFMLKSTPGPSSEASTPRFEDLKWWEKCISGVWIISILAGIVILFIGFLVTAAEPSQWLHWISIGLGSIASFICFFVLPTSASWAFRRLRNGWHALRSTWQAQRARRTEKHEARRRAQEEARRAKENAPEAVIARNKQRLDEFNRLVAFEQDGSERTRKANRLFEELKWRFDVIARLQQRNPAAPVDVNAEEVFEGSDKIFPDNPLPREELEETKRLIALCNTDSGDSTALARAVKEQEEKIEKLDLEIQRLSIRYLAEVKERTTRSIREEIHQVEAYEPGPTTPTDRRRRQTA